MNRLLTTLVQLMLAGGVIACLRLMWIDLKGDMLEILDEMREGK